MLVCRCVFTVGGSTVLVSDDAYRVDVEPKIIKEDSYHNVDVDKQVLILQEQSATATL